jgi:hypothetical protein
MHAAPNPKETRLCNSLETSGNAAWHDTDSTCFVVGTRSHIFRPYATTWSPLNVVVRFFGGIASALCINKMVVLQCKIKQNGHVVLHTARNARSKNWRPNLAFEAETPILKRPGHLASPVRPVSHQSSTATTAQFYVFPTQIVISFFDPGNGYHDGEWIWLRTSQRERKGI